MSQPPAKPHFDFKAALSRLPDQPGVYRMYSDAGKLLYVGKAKSLKSRVRSYFQSAANLAPKVLALMQHVTRFDYIVTDSEVEALILECNLIKQHRPKYNILLRDDKKFPWIGLSNEPFPRIFITRDPTGSGRFFGPYVNSGNMHKTLQAIRKHFPLRQRKKPLFKNRPCMNYYIGTCPGPCQQLITEQEYADTLRQVELFLKGKADDLLVQLDLAMAKASETMNYELAAKLRDRFLAVQDIVSEQKMFYPDTRVNQDIIAFACDNRRCAIVVLNIRNGKLIGSRPHEILLMHQASPEEAYNSFITQYYQEETAEDLPHEMIVQTHIEDEAVLEELLRQKAGRKIQISLPQKGLKKELLALGIKNAQETLEQAQSQEVKHHQNDPTRALMELQERLNLPEFPTRMECYDISHFQGSQTVASMVVFTDGVPDKKEYRRFKIACAEGEPNDFASMQEVMTRRFARAVDQESGWEEPSLVIIDGGKGQLSSAVEALQRLGLETQPIISLAKKFEEVYLPGSTRPVLLPRDSAALFVLQQIRDEAHRFAITYHRGLRAKKATRSALDDITQIGPKRKAALLKHFGSLSKIKAATIEELAAMPGFSPSVAEKLYKSLHPES